MSNKPCNICPIRDVCIQAVTEQLCPTHYEPNKQATTNNNKKEK